jgi:micrococcal nuclease
MRGPIIFIIGLIIPFHVIACNNDKTGETCGPESSTVTQVLDGDTVELDDGSRIRYLLIDTPEMNSSNSKDPECFAQEAKDFNEQLVLNKKITLEYDEDCDDAYDRLLAYVSVDDTSVNKLMLERGYAKLLFIEPNKLYLDEFEAVATLAENAKSGLWGACEE